MGKTSIALNMARAAIKDTNKICVIFQLEMSSMQLAMRLLSGEALIDNKKLRMGNLQDADWERIAGASTSLTNSRIMIDDNSGITVSEMKAKCRRLGNELGLIVVDYLQLMHSGKRNDNRVQEVAEISRGMKLMAKELSVPIVCCAQLSRGPESRTDKRPMLSDLRDSGAIEQDADAVLFLYRDEYYKTDETEDGNSVAEVIVAKNRHGSTGTVKMAWHGRFTKFITIADTEAP
jgi:replicative DNA helicase